MLKDQEKMGAATRQQARRLMQAMRLLNANAPRVSITDLILLLSVALNEGDNYREHGERTNVTRSAMTKVMMRLGDKSVYGTKGNGWIEEHPDPRDARSKIPRLTPVGREFVRLLLTSKIEDDEDDARND